MAIFSWLQNAQKVWEMFSLKFQIIWGWILFQYIHTETINYFLQFWRKLPQKKEADTFDVFLMLVPSSNLNYILVESWEPLDDVFYFRKAIHPEDQSVYYLGKPSSSSITSPFVALSPCFLSIYYVCENFETFIDLTPAFYISGSYILSPEFIRWWLEYNYRGGFVFNNSYKVYITDAHLNEFSIGWDESISLDAKCSPLPFEIVDSKKRV